MEVKDMEISLIEVKHQSGFGKTSGKAYDFYTLVFADDKFNRINATFGKKLMDTWGNIIPDIVFKKAEAREKVAVDLEIIPDGFGCKIIIEDMNLPS